MMRGGGKRQLSLSSMAPINHHFSPLPELPLLPPRFILPPDVFALFFQGPVQDENSAKRPRLMEFHESLFLVLLLMHCMLGCSSLLR